MDLITCTMFGRFFFYVTNCMFQVSFNIQLLIQEILLQSKIIDIAYNNYCVPILK